MTQTGLKRLDEYGLWAQIVDENGQEVLAHNKPDYYLDRYSMTEFVALAQSGYQNGDTVFVNSVALSDKAVHYVVCFPYAVGKYMLYYNGENVRDYRRSPKRYWSVSLAPLSFSPLPMRSGCLSISICDNGKGMSEAELADLWSRYCRGTNTKERPEGGGLGLAIAKQIVALHGGDISVKSNPGVGTAFLILLPPGIISKLRSAKEAHKVSSPFCFTQAAYFFICLSSK